eukprot:6095621-Pleurochrysis_carterae.AAC.1
MKGGKRGKKGGTRWAQRRSIGATDEGHARELRGARSSKVGRGRERRRAAKRERQSGEEGERARGRKGERASGREGAREKE